MEIYQRCNIAESMWSQWCMIECLSHGTEAMRQAAQAYLPRWPLEDADSYTFRLNTSFLFNAFEQTVDSLAGRPFCEPLKLNDDIPPRIRDLLEDADTENRNLHTFAQDVFHAGISYGHAFILVDFPSMNGANTQADLQAAGARPYMSLVHPQQVLHWEAEKIDGVMTLTEVRLWEIVEDQAGLYGALPIEQVRVLRRDRFEVWRPVAVDSEQKDKTWRITEEGENSLGFIPLVPFYAKRTGFFRSQSPLLNLAYLNVEHWQSGSDQRSILHTARVPLLMVTTDDETFSIASGASRAIRLPVGADAKWIETTGAAIGAGRQDLLDIEERMRLLGAELIIVNASQQSATQAQLLDNKSESKLGAMAQNLEDALNIALFYFARWLGQDAGGTVEVYQDFGVDAATAADEMTLMKSALAGKLSDQTLFDELKRRGTISGERTWEEEQERLAAQGPALGMLTEPPPANG